MLTALASRWSIVLIGGAMGFLLLTGLLKAASLDSFSAALASWTVIPHSLHPWITVFVPSIEVFVPLFWFLAIGRRHTVRMALSLLICLQIVVWTQLAAGQPPRCGCLGVLDSYFQTIDSGPWLAAKSGMLLLVLLLGVALGRTNAARPVAVTNFSAAGDARTPGFTLVEVLVCIAVFAVIALLTLPLLSRGRGEARATETAGRLRQHATVFHAYAGDWRDQLPLPSVPGSLDQSITLPRSGRTITFPGYFTGSSQWHSLLCESYYQTELEDPVFYPAEHVARWGAGDNGGIFWMPCTLMAAPDYWNPTTRIPQTQLRAVRTAEFLFASKKAILVSMYFVVDASRAEPNLDRAAAESSVPLVTLDGATHRPRGAEIRRGIDSADGPYPGFFHLAEGWPAMHTLDGVRGRDLP